MSLAFGITGQLGTELQRLDEVVALGRFQVDLSNPIACADAICSYAPNVVINAAAYTAVDHAEEEEALATRINRDAPTAMAQACAALNIPFIHISTDYVFDGSGNVPWLTTAPAAPQNAYGRSKMEAEHNIRASGVTHAILRTSWVVSAHGANFIKTMLRLSETQDKLKIVADQIGGPTPARDIATACLQIADQLQADATKSGTYHFSGVPDVSWADFASEIFQQANRNVMVTSILTSDYPTPALRPLNSRLDCSATELIFGISRPDWRVGLKQILQDLEGTA